MGRVAPGNYRDRDVYRKVFSELYLGEHIYSLSFLDLGAAERTAQKYQRLVVNGFYPPGSRFYAGKDDMGIITILSEMPALDPWSGSIKRLRRIAARTLGVKVDELWNDTLRPDNYGSLHGSPYYFDAHVLGFVKLLGDDQKYRKISMAD